MACHDMRQQMHAFLDGVLDDISTERMQHHLDVCRPCRIEVEGVLRIEDRLRNTFRDEPVPATLWRRIYADLGRQEILLPPGEQTRRGFLQTWLVTAAAVVVLALGIALGGSSLWAPRSLEAHLLSVPVQDLQTFVVSQRPLDVASPDPQHLRQWFQSKVDFSLPRLPVHAGIASLIGGRLCYFLDRRVASFMYTADSHYLSLYVMPRQGLQPPPQESVNLTGHQARVYEVQGYTHIVWSHTDLLYSLVSDLPQAQLVDLARKLITAG